MATGWPDTFHTWRPEPPSQQGAAPRDNRGRGREAGPCGVQGGGCCSVPDRGGVALRGDRL